MTHGNLSFSLNYDKKNRILVVCDNMYTMESKDELVFVDFFSFIQYLLLFMINIACNLFKTMKGFKPKMLVAIKI